MKSTHLTCAANDCDRKATRISTALCEKHYYRLRRNGGLELKVRPIKNRLASGYIMVREPAHPLANKGGGVYEHRKVYYDKYKDSNLACHWCEIELTWKTLHIDHLDEVRDNNAISNLVVSCPTCNQGRGRHKMARVMRKKGRLLTYKGITLSCNEWAAKLGIGRTTIMNRLDVIGMTVEQAFETPVGRTGRKKYSRGGE